MAVYFVTGKLGSGKSLSAVARIREKLAAGLPVATNLDVDLVALCGPKAKTPVLYRIPDKPGIEDFEAIGIGNASYDESKNGLVVLDECGTWFNSRTWGDKERQAIINWFLHARKKGWDLIFLVQSIAIVDKQARLTLAEHVVYCRRLDKLTIPFVSTIVKMFTGKVVRLPKIHLAIVKYGDQEHSLTVDRWWYVGTDLYGAYDTKQSFSDFYPHTTHQLLSPWLTRGRYMVPMTWRNIVRMTKIHWKRFSRPIIGGAFFAAGVVAAIYFREPPPAPAPEPVAQVEEQPVEEGAATPSLDAAEPVLPPEPLRPVRDSYAGWQIHGYMKLKDRYAYMVRSPDGQVRTLDAIALGEVDVMPRNNCHVRIVSAVDVEDYADLFAPGCIPDTAKPAIANAMDVLPKNRDLPYHPGVIRDPYVPKPDTVTVGQIVQMVGK